MVDREEYLGAVVVGGHSTKYLKANLFSENNVQIPNASDTNLMVEFFNVDKVCTVVEEDRVLDTRNMPFIHQVYDDGKISVRPAKRQHRPKGRYAQEAGSLVLNCKQCA